MVGVTVIATYLLFAFLLLEYTAFFWFKENYSALAGFVAANLVGFVFSAGFLVPLEIFGTLDLVASAGLLP